MQVSSFIWRIYQSRQEKCHINPRLSLQHNELPKSDENYGVDSR